MRALTRSVSASLLALAAPALAQTYEPALIPSQINGSPNTATPLYLGDDATAKVDLGFEFTYWGQTFTSAWVSSNGFVSFSTSNNLCCNGYPIEYAPRNTIYALWTDLVSYGGNPYYKRGEGSILFGWYGTTEYGTQNKYTFEIGLFDDNKIQFNYGLMPSLTYHYATAGITGPEAGDNIQLFYGRDPQFLKNQSGILSWKAPEPVVTIDCAVTPMDPSCPPQMIAPVQTITTPTVGTIQEAYAADVQADQAEVAAATVEEPAQEVAVVAEAVVETASVTERVAELVAAEQAAATPERAAPERLSPEQLSALAAPGAPVAEQSASPASAFSAATGPAFQSAFAPEAAPVPTGPPAVEGVAVLATQAIADPAQSAAAATGQGAVSASFSGALDSASPASSATSAANTLEVLNTLSAPAPQMAVDQQPTANAMAEGQGETIAAIANVPGFSAYTQVSLQDRPDFYAIRDIYRNRRLRDANFEMFRMTSVNNSKWQQMVDAQYER